MYKRQILAVIACARYVFALPLVGDVAGAHALGAHLVSTARRAPGRGEARARGGVGVPGCPRPEVRSAL